MLRNRWLAYLGTITLVACGSTTNSTAIAPPSAAPTTVQGTASLKATTSPVNQSTAAAPAKSATPNTTHSSPKTEASPVQNNQTRRGNFVNAEHPTRGVATISNRNGQNVIEFDSSFRTDSGPDLFVILHRSNDIVGTSRPPAYPINEGDYIAIAPLKSTTGQQTYPLPSNINPSEYRSVAVWCRQFNATFGAAFLSQ